MRKLYILLFVISSLSFAQLEHSKQFRIALEKNTRELSGNPGKNYWQNKADYNIQAYIDPVKGELKGVEKITYYNDSPDTLKRIVIKLLQNFYKPSTPRNTALPETAFTDGIIFNSFKINNKVIDTKPNNYVQYISTNMIVLLTDYIAPKGKIEIDIDFSFLVSPFEDDPRIGKYDASTYFFGYWYPKMAVYDDVFGWDYSFYDGEHEFYSDFSNYNIEVNVPEGFAVWATGTLQNPNEVMSTEVYNKYINSKDKFVKVIDSLDLNKKNFVGKVWKWKAEEMPDFAFGISDHYLWDRKVISSTGKDVEINVAYKKGSVDFAAALPIAEKTVVDLSKKVYPYPYSGITVFQGREGMEFPMIVNDGDFNDMITNVYICSHEITHMYFPFFVGINESKYAWMDEGMAYFLPVQIQIDLSETNHMIRAARGISNFSGRDTDLPLMTPSYQVREPEMSLLSYHKSAMAFEVMQDAMGEEMFYKGLNTFIERWKGKHPTPYDFLNTFNDVAKENYNWLFEPWFFFKTTPDLAVKKFENKTLTIEKVGLAPLPVYVTVKYNDGTSKKFYHSSKIWKNASIFELPEKIDGDVKSIELGHETYPDADRRNNIYPAAK